MEGPPQQALLVIMLDQVHHVQETARGAIEVDDLDYSYGVRTTMRRSSPGGEVRCAGVRNPDAIF